MSLNDPQFLLEYKLMYEEKKNDIINNNKIVFIEMFNK